MRKQANLICPIKWLLAHPPTPSLFPFSIPFVGVCVNGRAVHSVPDPSPAIAS